jgi:hypothetical protein
MVKCLPTMVIDIYLFPIQKYMMQYQLQKSLDLNGKLLPGEI